MIHQSCFIPSKTISFCYFSNQNTEISTITYELKDIKMKLYLEMIFRSSLSEILTRKFNRRKRFKNMALSKILKIGVMIHEERRRSYY